MTTRKLREAREQLERYFQEVSTIIVSRQNPATGLIPASVAITSHGDYRDAWVRDNVYSILAVWGLSLAYRRLDDDEGRAYELEHATIKCMRGLLSSMLRQAQKVELFKNTQDLDHALHAKYNTATGGTVVGDRDWGHLQIDATSIFLLMLAQMTASGLHIIYTMDEVHFVQNLVFYIERAYRTPDYGIWERGNKMNHGQPELNCSSIGMAVAALQTINGINLFGSRGGPLSVIHVLPDEITRNYMTLHSALPRESASKEIDAALLSVISFPAFAVSDAKLMDHTRNEIIKKLGGRYGCKRFLRDGHQTVLEDGSRLHYEPHELKIFEGVESEWPLFFTYMVLDGLFRNDPQQVSEYRELMESLLVDSSKIPQYSREYHFEHQAEHYTGTRTRKISFSKSLPPERMRLVPELYIVPREVIEAERARHGSQERVPNQNVPLVWAQSLYILGNLIHDGLLSVADIDPLNRRLTPYAPRKDLDTVVQVVFLSETAELQSKLRMYGLETQTIENCEPITISPASALRDAYEALGANQKLGLSGRPKRPMGTLSTCKVYRCQGQLYCFLPHFMDREEFYLVSDNDYLVSLFEQELAFVKNHWMSNGRPTMVVLITNQMLGGLSRNSFMDSPSAQKNEAAPRLRLNVSNSKRNLLNFMMSLRSSGICNGVRVRVGRLSEIINTACIESLDFLVDSENADFEDWEGVLRGRERRRSESQYSHLGQRMSSSPDGLHGLDESFANRCTLRKFSQNPQSPMLTKSPMTDPVTADYIDDHEEFRLRAHREDEPSKLEIGGSSDKLRAVSPTRPSRAGRGPTGVPTLVSHLGDTPVQSASNVLKEMPCDAFGPNEKASTEGGASELLALTLGDPSQVDAAIELLRTSANLYDQIDLLHYLYSCKGINFLVPGLCSVAVLLEEVYVKAMHIKQWSIVRQAAGLLRKIVNSLTSNITDLLVRQKPVTVGFGSQEYFVDSPKNPSTLADIIFSHCTSDVREAPLIQEIITYLGSFVRGSPQLFEGIMRIRTQFFVIAIREEISRIKRCDEEEAVELLMQLSPYEVKALMGQVLTARDQVDRLPDLNQMSPVSAMRTMHVHLDRDHSSMQEEHGTLSINMPNMVKLRAQSGGFQAGNFAKIEMQRDDHDHPIPGILGRGLNLALIDPIDGSILETAHFDTCASTHEADEFARRIERLQPGVIAVLAAKDDCASSLTEAAKLACEQLGSARIRQVFYRDSWCLIGEKGASPGSAVEFLRSAHLGPTEIIERVFDLAAVRADLMAKSGHANNINSAPTPGVPGVANAVDSATGSGFPALTPGNLPSSALIMPSNGRWLRRRKNDGALNRVPSDFYPKVWSLLAKTQGIVIGKAFLPRDPTISEKTPQEFNFALQVEALFDNIRDPAERQLAVETVVVVSRIGERNPEIRLQADARIEILKLIRGAVAKFWYEWVKEQGHQPHGSASDHHASEDSETARIVATVAGSGSGAAGGKPLVGAPPVGRLPTSIAGAATVLGVNPMPATAGPNVQTSALHANLEHQSAMDWSPLAPTPSVPSLSFEKNERLARRLFFDLPQDGTRGTMFYLASSCVRSIFDVHWSAS